MNILIEERLEGTLGVHGGRGRFRAGSQEIRDEMIWKGSLRKGEVHFSFFKPLIVESYYICPLFLH